jgi:nucleotide-binding universal stress UspA family protein
MFAIKRILFPVDFSARSAAVAKYAVELARHSQADLTVLHVVPGHASHVEGSEVSITAPFALELAYSEVRAKDATEKMAAFVESYLHGMSVTPCVLNGDAAKVIVEQAHSKKTDLIVMPTHGFGGFRRKLLGSVTAKVLHDVECPVFTSAHEASIPATLPPFRNILCAVDFGPQSQKVLQWANGFALSVGARLSILHALPLLPMGQFGYVEADLSIPIRKDAEEKVSQLMEATGVQAEVSMDSGPVADVVRKAAEDKHADLVVIGRHHQGGILGRLRDTAYAIVRESPCPVLSV